ncbi:DinB family protein [Bacillus sp. FJAT-26390]|uniref:DinB family protein n=1 Tax=Bacillus sp. FJAT-26390 TaxID=1743142 RepID=UPI0021000553|nr:DinB family protein [Bacillus sp. FJAT-26390]
MNLQPSKTFGLGIMSSSVVLLNAIVQFTMIYENGGSEVLGFFFFAGGLVILAFLIIQLIDVITKNRFVIQAKLVSKYKNTIYILRADGKVKRIRIIVPEIMDQLELDQIVEITFSSLARVPLHIVAAGQHHPPVSLKTFEHAAWANRQIFELLQQGNEPAEKPLVLFGHVLAAEQIWLARINGEDASAFPIWPEYSLEKCEELMQQNMSGYQLLFARLKAVDFNEKIAYPNSKGNLFHTAINDILTHVSLHGSYHRGQIASLIRQGGGTPINTDYIAFVRQLE